MGEMADPSNSSSAWVSFVADIKAKNGRENRKRGYEGQIEWSCPGEKLQRSRGPDQSTDQIHSHVSVE